MTGTDQRFLTTGWVNTLMAGTSRARSTRGRYSSAGYVRAQEELYIADVPAGSRQDELRDWNRRGYAYQSERPWHDTPEPPLEQAPAPRKRAAAAGASRLTLIDRMLSCFRRERRDAIFCGVLLYAMVMLSVGMAVPYPELLAKLDAQRATGGAAWGTGEVATMAFGKFGSIVLAVAVFGAVCTGTNGFFIATSRLLLSMSRSGILPAWFGEIHPKYRTPYKAILFTIIVVLLTPFAGRSAVAWTVDMSSVGTGIGYLFTCLAARRVIMGSEGVDKKGLKLFCCAVGTITAVMCILLLLVPGSPARIGTAPFICLAVWVVLGFIFYFSNKKHWISLPEEKVRENVLGRKDIAVFFKK